MHLKGQLLGAFSLLLSAPICLAQFHVRHCDNCVTPLPLCVKDCIFKTTDEYASNAIRLQLSADPVLFERIDAESRRRGNTYPPQPLAKWIAGFLHVYQAQENYEFKTPQLIRTDPTPTIQHPEFHPNCSAAPMPIKGVRSESTTVYKTTVDTHTATDTTTTEQFIKISGSSAPSGPGPSLSAEASQKITHTLQDMRTETITRHNEALHSQQTTTDFVVPPFNIATLTVVEKHFDEVYSVEGTARWDATLALDALDLHVDIGKWSVFVPSSDHEFPFHAEYKVPVSTFIYINDHKDYHTYDECHAAELALIK